MKIAIYSNYCGADAGARANVNYNRVNGYEHFFYTNNGVVAAQMQGVGWNVRNLDVPVTNDQVVSCMQAKEQKCRPHLLPDLQNYDFVVFRDAKMTGLDFAQLPKIIRLMQERGLHSAFPVHRRNVVAEACESMFQPRYAGQRQQITDYICEELERGHRARMPIHFGCNMFVRDTKHVDSEYVGENWMEHTVRVGLQDQVAFHFVAQQFPLILPIPQEVGYRNSEIPAPDWS
jgi:hypothetical protein